MEISFSKLMMKDLELMHKWLNEPEVKKWYGKNDDYSSHKLVYEKYCQYINGTKPTNAFIILIDGIKIGYIQYYFVKDYPDYNLLVNEGESTVGMDLLIGELDFLGKGYGSKIINNFIGEKIFVDKNISKVIIGPDPKNERAIKSYKKSGFKYLKTIKYIDNNEEEFIMQIEKEKRPTTGST